MDFNEYRKRGKEMVDYIADYLENIRDRHVFPNVKPGYMRNLIPESAPVEGEEWQKIFGDVERVIMPGITHWQSPHMHAYFPALNSFPSLLGDMLADAINCLGFTWASSPACTELETIVMNWLGKMIGLPDTYLHSNSSSKGGGVIQTTASEATLVCLLAGRTQAICRFHEHTPGLKDAEINARLVAYCSDQAHSSVEKAALIGLVRMRYIESDNNLSLRGAALQTAIDDDIKLGLIPFWVCATLGTTGACSFDNLHEITNVCQQYNIWVHVDAAYAGSSFICPEHRCWLKGIDKADSIAFNPSKWLMVHFDCTALWVRNSGALHRTFNVEPLYLQHENSGLAIDYMGVRLAQKFEALVLADNRFEIPAPRYLGMVVFRIKGENDLTEKLLKRLNQRGNIHCVPSSLKGKYVIRFTVTSMHTTLDDIIKDWTEIRFVTGEILTELKVKVGDRAKVPLKETREKNEAFGSSLLLANSPMSPKIVNGSFAAICDTDEFMAKDYAGIRMAASQNSPAMRRRVRGILMSGKQFSLDSRIDLVFHGLDVKGGRRRENNDSDGGGGGGECSGGGGEGGGGGNVDVIVEDVPDREAYEISKVEKKIYPKSLQQQSRQLSLSLLMDLEIEQQNTNQPLQHQGQHQQHQQRQHQQQQQQPSPQMLINRQTKDAINRYFLSTTYVPERPRSCIPDDMHALTDITSFLNVATVNYRSVPTSINAKQSSFESFPINLPTIGSFFPYKQNDYSNSDSILLNSSLGSTLRKSSSTNNSRQHLTNDDDYSDDNNVNNRNKKKEKSDLFSMNFIFEGGKRQSEPHIGFYNKSFDFSCADGVSTKRYRHFLSQYDVRQNAMPNIMEYCFEEPWAKLKKNEPSISSPSTSSSSSFSSNSIGLSPTTTNPTSAIKFRISDEWGRRINSITSPNSDLFDFSIMHESQETDQDAFEVKQNDDGDEQCCYQKKKCKKCGHQIN